MGVHGAAIIIVYSLRSRRMKIIWAQERRGCAMPKRPTKFEFFSTFRESGNFCWLRGSGGNKWSR